MNHNKGKKYVAIIDTFQKKNRFMVDIVWGKNSQDVLEALDNTYSSACVNTVMTVKACSELINKLEQSIR